MPLCLYSTNPWLKWHIHKRWRNDTHFVWCSPVFNPRKLGPDEVGSLIPPTSSPAHIYEDLAAAVRNRDRHNAKIIDQKASLTARIEQWRQAGQISTSDASEAHLMLSYDKDLFLWRPVLYVIPVNAIKTDRIETVPAEERAGVGVEFRIRDLAGTEFDKVEFDDR